jgi:hypothetical protein
MEEADQFALSSIEFPNGFLYQERKVRYMDNKGTAKLTKPYNFHFAPISC